MHVGGDPLATAAVVVVEEGQKGRGIVSAYFRQSHADCIFLHATLASDVVITTNMDESTLDEHFSLSLPHTYV